jgi:hypothetical protein
MSCLRRLVLSDRFFFIACRVLGIGRRLPRKERQSSKKPNSRYPLSLSGAD